MHDGPLTFFYLFKLANALKVRLQYARLKVSSGMTNKNLQEIEEAMIPRPITPTSGHRHDQHMGEQEEAAARTIMMLSSSRGNHQQQQAYAPPDPSNSDHYYKMTPSSSHTRPIYNHHHHDATNPPSLFDVVANDKSYYQKSREIGQQLPRLSHDAKLRHFKQQRKKTPPPPQSIVYGKDPFQSTKPYTAPRRGRPKKVTTSTPTS
jgi:hypothetical protein